MQLFSCCTLNVSDGRNTKICWTNEIGFCFSESFLLTAQMRVLPPVQSIIKSFTTNRPYTHSHANPPTETLIWIHFFDCNQEWLARPQTHPSRHFKPQLAAPFISRVCVLYLLSSSLHQRYSLHPDTVRLDPTKPDAPGCNRKTKYQQIPWRRRYFNPS